MQHSHSFKLSILYWSKFTLRKSESAIILNLKNLILFSMTGFFFAFPSNGHAAKFNNEIDKDFPLRSIGRLQLTNVLGDITVQSWAFDKIRIKISKETFAESEEKANALFEGMDYRYSSSAGGIELSSQYGKNLSIKERLQQKQNPRARLDIEILAPSYLNLKIWSAGGRVMIKNWNAFTDIRSSNGLIQIDGMNAEKLFVQCLSCRADLKDIRSSIRVLGGAGQVSLENAKGKSIYIETGSGSQRVAHVEGEQLYVSKKGTLEGQFLEGKVEFHTQEAAVNLREVSGFLSGTANTGNITASIRDWEASDQALIETVRGNITLVFPETLSADADIWSVGGATLLGFHLVRSQDSMVFGPEPTNHLVGRVGDGGPLLRVFSEHGDVSVIQAKF
jgi:DUF4097 and DUF4098 domain-containing protein YvlB